MLAYHGLRRPPVKLFIISYSEFTLLIQLIFHMETDCGWVTNVCPNDPDGMAKMVELHAIKLILNT